MGLERGPLSLVSKIEELLGRKSSDSGIEIREYGRRDPSRWPRGTFYLQTLALTSPTSGCRLVGIVLLRTQATECRRGFQRWTHLMKLPSTKFIPCTKGTPSTCDAWLNATLLLPFLRRDDVLITSVVLWIEMRQRCCNLFSKHPISAVSSKINIRCSSLIQVTYSICTTEHGTLSLRCAVWCYSSVTNIEIVVRN
jgi:hypothetical protein